MPPRFGVSVRSAIWLPLGIDADSPPAASSTGLRVFAVTTRTREIGACVALGASRRRIVRLVLGQGAVVIGAGTGMSLLIAFVLSRALAATADFLRLAAGVTYLMIVAALVVTPVAGLLRPVRRALALQPLDALRRE